MQNAVASQEAHQAFKATQNKLTRQKLADLLFKEQSPGSTLNVGAGNAVYKLYFPNMKTLDVDASCNPDYVCDAEDMRSIFEDNVFDVVTCLSVLEHTLHPQRVVDEMFRVLKPGGKLIVSVPFIYHLHNVPHDYWRFTKYGLDAMLSDFEEVQIQDSMSTMETMQFIAYRMRAFCETRYPRRIGRVILRLQEAFYVLFQGLLTRQRIRNSSGDLVDESNILVSDYYAVAKKPEQVAK